MVYLHEVLHRVTLRSQLYRGSDTRCGKPMWRSQLDMERGGIRW